MPTRRSALAICCIRSFVLFGITLFAVTPAMAEVINASGAALTVHGPFELTAEALRQLSKQAAWPMPGIDADAQAREALEREEEPDRSALDGLPPVDLPAEGAGWLDKAAQTAAPVASWKGLESTGDLAADVQIAVSHTHVVVTTRTTIGFFDKSGKLLQRIGPAQLFGPAHLEQVGSHGGVRNYFDNRAIFDAYRNRFWIGALVYDTALADTNLNKFVVAVSKTLDPRDGWWIYWWNAAPGDGQPGVNGNAAGDSADYPLLGVDPLHFVQTNYVADNTPFPRPAGYHLTAQVSYVSAAPMVAGQASSGYQYYDLPGAVFGVQPVVHHGASSRSYFVNTYDASHVAVWSVVDPLLSSRKLERTLVSVRPFTYPVDAPQKGGGESRILMTNAGNMPLKAVYRGGRLYVSFNDAANWFGDGVLASARFLRLAVGSFPTVPAPEVDRTFGGNSSFYDAASDRIHYGFPAVEANSSGDAVLVYGRSGSTIYPEVNFSSYPLVASDILPSRRLKQGENTFRFGTTKLLQLHDTTGAAVDPFDDSAVWVAAPYATKSSPFSGDDNYAVWVGKAFGVATPDLVVTAVAFTPGSLARGSRTKLKVTTTLRNAGDGNAGPSKLKLALRPFVGGADVLLGELSVGAIPSGQTRTVSGSFALPAGVTPGTYTLRATADSTNVVLEYSGANNGGSSTKLLQIQ